MIQSNVFGDLSQGKPNEWVVRRISRCDLKANANDEIAWGILVSKLGSYRYYFFYLLRVQSRSYFVSASKSLVNSLLFLFFHGERSHFLCASSNRSQQRHSSLSFRVPNIRAWWKTQLLGGFAFSVRMSLFVSFLGTWIIYVEIRVSVGRRMMDVAF